MLVGLVALSGCFGSDVPKPPPPAELEQQGFLYPDLPRITAEEFKLLYDKNEPYILIDARPRNLFLDGYIPGAQNIPNDPREDSVARLTQLPKNRLIVTYCDCMDDEGGAVAADRLLAAGYTNVKILWKGIYYWEEIGGEIRQ